MLETQDIQSECAQEQLKRSLFLLNPADAMAMWKETLCYHVVLTMPEIEGWSEERAMLAIQQDKLFVWLYSENGRLLAVLTTTFEEDKVTGKRTMLIYTASAAETLEMLDWYDMFEQLKNRARRLGCGKIVAYTKVGRMLEIVEALGGSIATRYCELEV